MIYFSICICTYNRADSLKKCIESVVKSSNESEDEILVIDNNSTDCTKELVLNLARKFPQIRYQLETKVGLSIARNSGLSIANGKFIIYLDDDCEVSLEWRNAFYHTTIQHPDFVGFGGPLEATFSTNKPRWAVGRSLQFFGHWKKGDYDIEIDWVPGGNSAWKTFDLKSVGGFSANMGRCGNSVLKNSEESDAVNKLLKRGRKFFYSSNALAYHHVLPERNSISWMIRRFYGQGYTAGILFSANHDRKSIFIKLLIIIIWAFRQGFRTCLFATKLNFSKSINYFFMIFHDIAFCISLSKELIVHNHQNK